MLIDVTNPLVDWIFPRRCLICSIDLANDDACATCLSLCHPCPNPLFPNNIKNASLFYYECLIKDLIRQIKFNRNMLFLHLLLKVINQQLVKNNFLNDVMAIDAQAITFVPTHWGNRIIRGVDLPYLFAMLLKAHLNLPVISTLKRKGFLNRQVLRSRQAERRQFIRGAFQLKNVHRYERLLLVDDVTTTGATFDEAKTMLNGICDDIVCLAIAKTP